MEYCQTPHETERVEDFPGGLIEGAKSCGYLRNATCSHTTLKLEATIQNDRLIKKLFMNAFTFVN